MKVKKMYQNKHEQNNVFFSLSEILKQDEDGFRFDIENGQYDDEIIAEMENKNCNRETAIQNIVDSLLENDVINDDFRIVIVDENESKILCDKFESDGTPIYPIDSDIEKSNNNDTLEITDLTIEE
jgi:hypothetical protein